MKLFVWDFHGVLEHGNDLAVTEITNIILEAEGFSRFLSEEESHQLSGKRWYEYYAYLLPDLHQDEHLRLQSLSVKYSNANLDIVHKHVKLNHHALDVLENIKIKNHTQIVISNTQPNSLDMFLKVVGIEKYFLNTHRFGVDQKNTNKISALKSFVNQRDFSKGMVTIGDSPGDMELAEVISNSKRYLYTHPGRLHRQCEADYKIFDLREVLREL